MLCLLAVSVTGDLRWSTRAQERGRKSEEEEAWPTLADWTCCFSLFLILPLQPPSAPPPPPLPSFLTILPPQLFLLLQPPREPTDWNKPPWWLVAVFHAVKSQIPVNVQTVLAQTPEAPPTSASIFAALAEPDDIIIITIATLGSLSLLITAHVVLTAVNQQPAPCSSKRWLINSHSATFLRDSYPQFLLFLFLSSQVTV